MAKKRIELKFIGIDDWSRPVYKGLGTKNFFGSTNVLFPDKRIAPNDTVEEINNYFKENMFELCYFGNHFNCEPMGGGMSKEIEYIII